MLIACWLALQDDVEDVIYIDSSKYLIDRGNMGKELRRFLSDMEVLLETRCD